MLTEGDLRYLEGLVGLYRDYGEDVGSAEMGRITGGLLERLQAGTPTAADCAWLLERLRGRMDTARTAGDPGDPALQAFLEKCRGIAGRLAEQAEQA